MKLVIFGANGKTGQQLINQALEGGHLVTAYVRRIDSITLNHPNLRILVGQLSDRDKLREATEGCEVCFSTLGGASLSKRSTEISKGIDHIVNIMEEFGPKRFIYLSSIGAGDSRKYMGPLIGFMVAGLFLRIPLADHTLNENRISASQLNWTVVRPGGLTDGEKNDSIQHGSQFIRLKGNPKISRANVASLMLEIADKDIYPTQAVWCYER